MLRRKFLLSTIVIKERGAEEQVSLDAIEAGNEPTSHLIEGVGTNGEIRPFKCASANVRIEIHTHNRNLLVNRRPSPLEALVDNRSHASRNRRITINSV
jgi:hypothetical protein